MSKQHVLIVEDEKDIVELVKYNLVREGYQVSCAFTGEQGLKIAGSDLPDLVLLDLMLPGIDGLEVCRILKNDPHTRHIPVVMLTAKGEESDIVAGLEIGADDYVTKPFSPQVLIARLRAALRRKSQPALDESATIRTGNMTIDPGRFEVVVDGATVALTLTEFKLLHALARRPGWVFTRDQLVNAARGEDVLVTDRTVDVHVAGLRRKLGDNADCIETVRGVGYRFKE
jgi:two-component system alkaline phosphatase synthesis response regulator PhoP